MVDQLRPRVIHSRPQSSTQGAGPGMLEGMATVRAAITGFGTIGRRTAALISQRQDYLASRFGVRLSITGVCTSSAGIIDADGLAADQLKDSQTLEPGLTGSRFIDRVPADVLIETGPSNYTTGQPGLDYLRTALDRRMHVVAVSKGALVVDGSALMQQARQAGVQLRMSGAAASALPSVDFLTHDLAGMRIQSVQAILTGTTTFILDSMISRDASFDAAVAEAQRQGIAEPDPTFDVDGWDTAAKVVIIANAVFDADMGLTDVSRQSLRQLSSGALAQARRSGLTPRLVGRIDTTDTGLSAGVELGFYDRDHPFSTTAGSTKALWVDTAEMGEFTLIGGASHPDATAAAAFKDIHHILTTGFQHGPQ